MATAQPPPQIVYAKRREAMEDGANDPNRETGRMRLRVAGKKLQPKIHTKMDIHANDDLSEGVGIADGNLVSTPRNTSSSGIMNPNPMDSLRSPSPCDPHCAEADPERSHSHSYSHSHSHSYSHSHSHSHSYSFSHRNSSSSAMTPLRLLECRHRSSNDFAAEPHPRPAQPSVDERIKALRAERDERLEKVRQRMAKERADVVAPRPYVLLRNGRGKLKAIVERKSNVKSAPLAIDERMDSDRDT